MLLLGICGISSLTFILILLGRKEKKKITTMKAWPLQHGTSEKKKEFLETMGMEIEISVEGLEDKAE